MWPFSTGPRHRCDCIERVEALERQLKALDLEWSSTYEKFRRLYARISKRSEREEAPESPSEPSNHGPPTKITNPLARALLQGGQREW